MSFAVIADLFVSKNIVHVAALLFLLGFLSRDQFILRGLVLLGDLLYVLYFYFAPGRAAVGRDILERHVRHCQCGDDLADLP